MLSDLFSTKKSSTDNNFARFASFGGQGTINPLSLKIFIPSLKDSLTINIRKEASVEEAIGYILFELVNSGRDISLQELSDYALRIVEDDGGIDEDFPPLERARGVAKFGFESYALVLSGLLCICLLIRF